MSSFVIVLQIGVNYDTSDDTIVAGSTLAVYITPRDDIGGLIFYPERLDFNVTIAPLATVAGSGAEVFSTFPEHTANGYDTSATPPRIMVVRRAYTVCTSVSIL